jgi:hypothetical protein
MLHESFAKRFDRLSARGFASLIKPGMAIVLAMTLLGLSPAQAQGHKKRKDQQETFYTIVVKFRGTGSAEVSIMDAKQNRKEILRTTLSEGQTANAKAWATVTRQTQDTPETDIRWKVTGWFDDAGKQIQPDSARKPTSWCGDFTTSRNRATVDVGFKGSVLMGQSC